MIKAVLFDVDGVVITGGQFRVELERTHGITPAITAPFFRTAFRDCLIGSADLREALVPYLGAWDWRESVDALLNFWFQSERTVDEALLADISAIRQSGVPCWLATNQEEHRTGYIWSEVGLSGSFDGIFSSARVGCVKDDPAFFAAVLNELAGADPEEIAFWDDFPPNVEVARAAGLRTELYTSLTEFRQRAARYGLPLCGAGRDPV